MNSNISEVENVVGAITPPVSVADLDDEGIGQPCPDCGCLPSERAEGSDGDPATNLFRQWLCPCVCHCDYSGGRD